MRFFGLLASTALGLALLTSSGRAAPGEVPSIGSVLPGPLPTLEPLRVPEPTLDRVRRHLEAGDVSRALADAARLAEVGRTRRDRDASLLLVGLLEREQGHPNLASDAFTRVRAADGPLAPWAAYHEAEQDLARGREWVSVKECEKVRQRWPDGPHASDCLRLIATAHAALGNVSSSRAAARAYDEEHENRSITEQVELALATRLATGDRPEDAVPLLRALAIRHDAPLTGRVARELLDRLRADGIASAVLPEDADSRILLAMSLRDSGRRDEAWAAFEALSAAAADDPKLARFVTDQGERFGWRTHRWDFLADWYGDRYTAGADPEDSWNRYRVLVRGARYGEASDLALEMQKKHSASRDWRRSEEDVGRTMMLARRYPDAKAQFDTVAARGGWTGRRAAFSAAFCSLMAGELEESIGRFDRIVDNDKTHALEARYWRSRALQASERVEDAEADRRWILETDPWSWYGVMVRQQEELPGVGPFARDGRWAGPPPPAGDPGPAVLQLLGPVPLSAPVSPPLRDGAAGFATARWDLPAPDRTRALLVPPPPPVWVDSELEPPVSYRASALFDPERGRAALNRFAEQNGETWPELRAIADLASVGLYDLSGPLMSEWFEAWREDYRRGRMPARKLQDVPTESWRELFLAARDHHHAARFTYGLWESFPENPELAREAWRLSYPLAHDRYVWTESRRSDLDPYLILGLMRQESTYDATALSRVGARGAMQIMPRTGHLLADLAHDTKFTAGDLEDPVRSVGMGIRYLGLLMERFDHVYPLAVASYNGGPFNVSAWRSGVGEDTPIDVFVEHVPFRETRDYVKKVTAGYAAYVALYAPAGSELVVPPQVRGDHREVVDF